MTVPVEKTASKDFERIIVIGASAGALDALTRVLPALPPEYPYPVLVVVHVPPDKNSILPSLMQAKCSLRVKEAEDKEFLHPGTVYFAPPDYHLLVEKDGSLSLSTDWPVLFSRPSIDVLFESAADAYGDAVTGIILTGANADGAAGLRAVCQAGGRAMVQDPQTAPASAMPQAAAEACPNAVILPLENIAEQLKRTDLS